MRAIYENGIAYLTAAEQIFANKECAGWPSLPSI